MRLEEADYEGSVGHHELRLDQRLAEIREGLRLGRPYPVAVDLVDSLVEDPAYRLVKGTEEYKKLVVYLTRAIAEATRATIAFQSGDYAFQPTDPILVQPMPKKRDPAASFSALVDRFEAVNRRGVTPQTMQDTRTSVLLLADFHPDLDPADIRRTHVVEWRDWLDRLPRGASRTRPFAGLSMRDAVAANEREGAPVISRTAVNKHLSGPRPLSLFSRFAIFETVAREHPVAC